MYFWTRMYQENSEFSPGKTRLLFASVTMVGFGNTEGELSIGRTATKVDKGFPKPCTTSS